MKGRRKAFAELVGRYQNMVYSTILARLGPGPDVDDLVQDVFVSAYTNLAVLEDRERFAPWVRRIAENRSLTYLRSRQTRRRHARTVLTLPATEAPQPDTLLEAEEDRARIWEAIGELPDDQREVLLLHYLEEHTARQVATYLGVSVSTVKGRLQRARALLREALVDFRVRAEVRQKRKGPKHRGLIVAALPALRREADASWWRWGRLPWVAGAGAVLVAGAAWLGEGWVQVPWGPRREPGGTLLPEIRVRLASRTEHLRLLDDTRFGGRAGAIHSLFGGSRLSSEGRSDGQEALAKGRGGHLVWEFEEGVAGWRAREGRYSRMPPPWLATSTHKGVLRIELGAYAEGRVPSVELISPEIGYGSALFDRVSARIRLVWPPGGGHAAPASFSVSWTNPLNRVFPGQDPHFQERRDERQALEGSDARGQRSLFQRWGADSVELGTEWGDVAFNGLAARPDMAWEGDLADMRLGFLLADLRGRRTVQEEDFPLALEVDRIELSHGGVQVAELERPQPVIDEGAGTWLACGPLHGLGVRGLEWPILTDLDGDGATDLAATYLVDRPGKGGGNPRRTTEQGWIAVRGDGQGGFAMHRAKSFEHQPEGGNSVLQFAAADLNGDGLGELVVGRGTTTVLVWNEDGQLHREEEWPDRFLVGVGDVNGDGALDVATVPYVPVEYKLPRGQRRWPVAVRLNDGRGAFAEALPGWTPDDQGGWFPEGMGDLDRDGRIELVWRWVDEGAADAVVAVFRAAPGMVWQEEARVRYQTLPEARTHYLLADRLMVADLDGDGRIDVGVPAGAMGEALHPGLGMVVLRPNGETEPWLPASVHLRHGFHHQPRVMALTCDLNGDGITDPVVADVNYKTGGGVRVYRGVRGAWPELEGVYKVPGIPLGVACADLDGDGDEDVAALVRAPGGDGVVMLQSRAGASRAQMLATGGARSGDR